MHRIYGAPALVRSGGSEPAISAEQLWLGVARRVEAAGALAVRLGAWWSIRPLTFQPVTLPPESYGSWLRHAITMAARSNLLVNAEGQPVSGAFVGFGRLTAAQIPALRPDYPGDAPTFELGAPPESLDPLLDSVTQFDLLWCTVAAAAHPNQLAFCPSFAGFWEHRSEPALRALVTDTAARREILGDISDEHLRAAIKEVMKVAAQESWRIRYTIG